MLKSKVFFHWFWSTLITQLIQYSQVTLSSICTHVNAKAEPINK